MSDHKKGERWAAEHGQNTKDAGISLAFAYNPFDICYSFLVCLFSLIYVTDNTIETALAMENIHALQKAKDSA